MKCRLVQESWVPFPDAVYDRVGNILLSGVMGGEIVLARTATIANVFSISVTGGGPS